MLGWVLISVNISQNNPQVFKKRIHGVFFKTELTLSDSPWWGIQSGPFQCRLWAGAPAVSDRFWFCPVTGGSVTVTWDDSVSLLAGRPHCRLGTHKSCCAPCDVTSSHLRVGETKIIVKKKTQGLLSHKYF